MIRLPRGVPLLALALALALGAACAGPGAPVPPGLAYGEPEPSTAVYTFTDTTDFRVSSPGAGPMAVRTTQSGMVELRFGPPSEHGVEVEVRFPRFRATFENESQGGISADQRDIGGALVVELGYDGGVDVVDRPILSPTLREIAGAETLVRPFFVHLPAAPVEPGATWVDTVVVREESAGTVTRSRTVIRSILAGDTLLGERRALRILTRSRITVASEGVSGGTEVRQSLEGTVEGRVLWDERARLLVDRVEAGELTGTLGMPETGVEPLPVVVRVRRAVSLRR